MHRANISSISEYNSRNLQKKDPREKSLENWGGSYVDHVQKTNLVLVHLMLTDWVAARRRMGTLTSARVATANMAMGMGKTRHKCF